MSYQMSETCPDKPAVKPPLGLIPREMHELRRLFDIIEAIERYSAAKADIPSEWLVEMRDILNRIYPT